MGYKHYLLNIRQNYWIVTYNTVKIHRSSNETILKTRSRELRFSINI